MNRYLRVYPNSTGGAQNRFFDNNGNLIEDDARFFKWDYANRLIEVQRKTDAVPLVSYQVNAFGLRIWKDPGAAGGTDIVYYYHDGARVIEERDSAEAVAATYVWGVEIDCLLQMQRAGVKYWFHANPLDSNYLVTDNAGNNVERYGYEDYGKPLFWKWNAATGAWDSVVGTQIGNPYLFQGREYDPEAALGPNQPLGLYYFRARYMDPHEQGRFLSRDPYGQ